MPNEDRNIFRKQALENTAKLGSLEKLMIIVSGKEWIAITTIIALVFLTILWSIVGAIPDEVKGEGILINEKGNFILVSMEEGNIENIFVKVGEIVKEGQLLITMKNDDLETKLRSLLQEKQNVERQKLEFKNWHEQKIDAKYNYLSNLILNSKKRIEQLKNELVFLKKDFEWKIDLYKKGLLALPEINKARENISDKINEKNNAYADILNAITELKGLKDLTQLQEYEDKLMRIEAEIESVQFSKNQLDIYSHFNGKIISIPIKQKDYVEKGRTIVWVEEENNEEKDSHYFYAYCASSFDQRIKEGMNALIRLNDVDYKKYGDMMAKVVKVSSFPVSPEEVEKVVGSTHLAEFLTKENKEISVQVVLKPYKDKTPSGYKWTSKVGPLSISSGAIGSVKVEIELKKPIEFIFPIFRTVRDSFEFSRKEK